MLVTVEQLQGLIEDLRIRFMPTWEYGMSRNPESIAYHLRHDYGVEGVLPPPAYETIVREYTPADWRAQHPGAPRLESNNPLLESLREPPSYEDQVLADLDLLRSSPIAALVYVLCRSTGVENQQAIAWGRLASLVATALMAGTRTGQMATQQAISGSSGRERDAHITRAEQQVRMDQFGETRQQGPGPPLPAPTPQRPPRPLRPNTPPDRVMQRLERMAQQHGRNTARVR